MKYYYWIHYLALVMNTEESPSFLFEEEAAPTALLDNVLQADGLSPMPVLTLEFDGVVSPAMLSLNPFVSSKAYVPHLGLRPNSILDWDIENGSIYFGGYEWSERYMASPTEKIGTIKASVDSPLMTALGGLLLRVRNERFQDVFVPPVGETLDGMLYYPLRSSAVVNGRWQLLHRSVNVKFDISASVTEVARQFARQWTDPSAVNMGSLLLNPAAFGDVDIHLDNINRRIGFIFIL